MLMYLPYLLGEIIRHFPPFTSPTQSSKLPLLSTDYLLAFFPLREGISSDSLTIPYNFALTIRTFWVATGCAFSHALIRLSYIVTLI